MIEFSFLEVGLRQIPRLSGSVVNWFSGQSLQNKTILLIGPSRSGKTSFLRFVQFGHFADDQEERTLDPVEKKNLAIRTDKGSVEVKVKKIVDTVGQADAREHARNLADVRHHAVCIFVHSQMDVRGSDQSSVQGYITELFDQFDDLLDGRRKKSPPEIIIVYNKVDLIESQRGVENRNAVHQIARENAKRVFGKDASRKLRTLSCSLVEEFDNGALAGKVVQKLIEQLV